MNSKQLFYVSPDGTTEPTGIYECTACHNFYSYDKELADECCAPKICPDCGNVIPKSSYHTKCGMCLTNDKIEKFKTKIKFVDEQYDDVIWVEEEWYDSIDDYVEQTFLEEEDIQEVYAYASENYKIQLNADHILEDIEESCVDDLPEDRTLKDDTTDYDILSGKIKQAVEEYNLAQKEYFFRPNYNEGILYTEEYLKKLFEENNK